MHKTPQFVPPSLLELSKHITWAQRLTQTFCRPLVFLVILIPDGTIHPEKQCLIDKQEKQMFPQGKNSMSFLDVFYGVNKHFCQYLEVWHPVFWMDWSNRRESLDGNLQQFQHAQGQFRLKYYLFYNIIHKKWSL